VMIVFMLFSKKTKQSAGIGVDVPARSVERHRRHLGLPA
jgi:hypothetical protein